MTTYSCPSIPSIFRTIPRFSSGWFWSIERNKIEAMLRELLDAGRNRKSEQLSADQLALFETLWQARQAQTDAPAKGYDSDDDAAGGGAAAATSKRRMGGGRQPLPKHLQRERIVHDLAGEESIAPRASRTCVPSGKRPASVTNTSRRN